MSILVKNMWMPDDCFDCPKKNIESQIAKIPSAQTEIVKCEKCRYVYYDKEFDNYWCDRTSGSFKVEADGYCKWGK